MRTKKRTKKNDEPRTVEQKLHDTAIAHFTEIWEGHYGWTPRTFEFGEMTTAEINEFTDKEIAENSEKD